MRRVAVQREEQEISLLPQECSFSPEFGVVVHRFSSGDRVCFCGECHVLDQQQLARAGWFGRGFKDGK